MSLSNKILIGFFGFIFLYLSAVFLEIRLTGTPNSLEDDNSKAESVDISDISFLVLDDFENNVHVVGSDQSKLEVRSQKGDLLKSLRYSISGDTLKASGVSIKSTNAIRISIFVPKASLRGIRTSGTLASLEGLQQELLQVTQRSGRIRIGDNQIAKMEIALSNQADMEINTPRFDSLSANVDNSQVIVNSSIGQLSGSLKNNSYMHVNDFKQLQFDKDESSRLTVQ